MHEAFSEKNENIFLAARRELRFTRERAAELLQWINEDRLEKIEKGMSPPRPEEVLQIARVYKKPELCNKFCSEHCEIGMRYVPKIELKDLSAIVLELLASLNGIQKRRDRLIEIASDGMISEDEFRDLDEIQAQLEKISVTTEALQLWVEKMKAQGAFSSL